MWKGLPATSESDVEHLREEKLRARASGGEEECAPAGTGRAVQLVPGVAAAQRGEGGGRGDVPSGIQLPFILVQTRPSATVEVEISEDQQVVHFDFSGMPFQIHDGNFVLANMNLGPWTNLNLGDDPTDERHQREGLVRDAAEDAVANGNQGHQRKRRPGVSGEGAPGAGEPEEGSAGRGGADHARRQGCRAAGSGKR